jgi:Tol biopolymer transport system component
MNADGSGQRRVPNTDGGEYPSWSPDGKRIAFNSNLTGDHVMYIVAVDGSNLVDLSSVGEGWQVQWSPDGRSILFTSHRDHPDNYTDVYVMRPDGSAVRRLTYDRAYTPAWSPDGDHMVFSAPGLFITDSNGTHMRELSTPRVGETSLPDWTDSAITAAIPSFGSSRARPRRGRRAGIPDRRPSPRGRLERQG